MPSARRHLRWIYWARTPRRAEKASAIDPYGHPRAGTGNPASKPLRGLLCEHLFVRWRTIRETVEEPDGMMHQPECSQDRGDQLPGHHAGPLPEPKAPPTGSRAVRAGRLMASPLPPPQQYTCARCERTFAGPSLIGWNHRCPPCGAPPPFAVTIPLQPARAVSSATMELTAVPLMKVGFVTVRASESTTVRIDSSASQIVPEVRADLAKNAWDLTMLASGATVGGLVGRTAGAAVGIVVFYAWGHWRWKSQHR